MESATVMMVTFLEEYLNSLVSVATLYREAASRAYLAANGSSEERGQSQTCNVGTLIRIMQRRVSFKQRARRLENIFGFLFHRPQPMARR
jgi:hypothetical protein